MNLQDLRSTGRQQLIRLRDQARLGLSGQAEPAQEEWAIPPVRDAARADVRATVVAGPLLTEGLAREWSQSVPANPVGASAAVALDGAELLLLEYVDGELAGREESDSAVLLRQAVRAGVPVIVWATSGGAPVRPDALVAAQPIVHVADEGQAESWRAIVPDVQVLPRGASLRRHGSLGPDRSGATMRVDGPIAPELAGIVATHLSRAIRPLEDVTVIVEDPDAPLSLPMRKRTGTPIPISDAAVVVDGPRSHLHDTTAILEAGALRTSVVGVGPLPVPEDLRDLVRVAQDKRSLRSEIIARIEQSELRDREALALHRAVHAAHGLGSRVDEILDRAGIRAATVAQRSVSAIVPTNRVHEIDNVLANLGRQSHRDLELVLVLHGIDVDRADLDARAKDAGVPNLTVLTAPRTWTLGSCMNLGVEASHGAYVAKMDDDNYYGRHYLTDLLNASETSGAGIVGKWAHYVWLRSNGAVVLRYPATENTYVRRIQGGSMLFDGDLVRDIRFSDIPRAVDSDILDRSMLRGVKIWSADRFNYVSVRGVDRHAHTWTVDDASFMTASGRLAFYGDPRQHVEA